MKKGPVVSIVMPAYNASAFIAESIQSVQKQTFNSWELLVIDDSSTDNTLRIIKDFAQRDHRIRVHSLPVNQGAGFARNIGIKASKGDYISFLDADDLWKPHKLQTQLNFMKKHGVAVSYSSYELMEENGKSLNQKVQALKELSYSKLLRANYVGNLTGMYCSGEIGKIYSPPIRKRQDWGLWLKAVEKAGIAKGITEPLAKYRVRKGSISGNKWKMLQYNYKVYRKVLNYSAVKSSYWFSQFLYEQFFVKSKQTVPLDK